MRARLLRMLGSSASIYALGRVVNAGLSVVTLIAVNRLIDPAVYGRFSYLTMIGGFIALVAFGWVWTSIYRSGAQHSVRTGMRRGSVWLGLALPACLLLALVAAYLTQATAWEALYLASFPLAYGLFTVGQKLHASHSRLIANIAFAITRSAVHLAILLSIVLLFHEAWALLAASLGGYLVAAVVALVIEQRSKREEAAQTLPRLADFRYGTGIAASALLTQLNYGLDKLVVNHVLGDEQTGLYTHSYEWLFFIIMFVFSIYNISTYPKLQRRFDRGEVTLATVLNRSFHWFMLISGVLVAGLWVVRPVFDVVISAQYLGVFQSLYFYNIAIALMSCLIAFHVNYAFQLTKQPAFQVVVGLVALLVNLVLSLSLVGRFGLEGVASATILAQAVMAVMALVYARRFYRGAQTP